MEPDVIIEDWSPVGNIQAFVEKTDKNYYLYLWINPESDKPEIRSCWICNRKKAPKSIEDAFAVEGEAPCMPAEFVAHDSNGIDLDESALHLQWFEEGDSVALLSGSNLLAVIPCFSGYDGFSGYSVYAKGTGPFAWELKQAYSHFEEQVKRSRDFWDFFETDYWGEVQDTHMNALESFFGPHDKYYAIDRNEFPPKAMATGRKGNVLYTITLGVSMIPMPKVEMNYNDDYRKYRRMELGFACDTSQEKHMHSVMSAIAYLASMPWEEQTFLGHGHTVPFDEINGYSHLLFLNSRELNIPNAPQYKDFLGDPINLLWLKPITKSEYDYIVENGSAAYLNDKDASDIIIFQ
jgi:hypothetical protein